jgi:hypothetical protein
VRSGGARPTVVDLLSRPLQLGLFLHRWGSFDRFGATTAGGRAAGDLALRNRNETDARRARRSPWAGPARSFT